MHPAIHIAIWSIPLAFIGIAVLLKRHPDSLAGYNALSDEKKKNIDLPAMVAYIYKGMLIVSWTAVPVAYMTYLILKNERFALWAITGWIVAGIILIVILSKKFDYNKKRNKLNNKQI